MYSLPGRFSREVYWCMLHVGTASCALLMYCTFQHPISDGTASCWWACLLLSDPCWVLWGAVCVCAYMSGLGVVSSVPPLHCQGRFSSCGGCSKLFYNDVAVLHWLKACGLLTCCINSCVFA